jgi:protease-4
MYLRLQLFSRPRICCLAPGALEFNAMRTRAFVIWMIVGFVFLSAAFGYATYKSVSVVLADLESEMGGDFEDEDDGNVAILSIKGVIMEADDVLRDLRRLEEIDSLKAIVVRIDSPGGAVGPSEEIYEELMRLRAKTKLKIVCSLGDIAASGGYYIASACEKIVSNAGTLTGSIGVIMPLLNATDLYKWAKIEPVTVKAGRYKDMGSDSRPMKVDERALLDEMLSDIHKTFKRHVLEGRALMKPEVIEEYADGRVFTGQQALALGFVDIIGGEAVAITEAAKLAGIKGEPEVMRRTRHPSRWRDLFSSFGEEEETSTPLKGAVDTLIGRLAPPALQLPPGRVYLMPYHFFEGVGAARAR